LPQNESDQGDPPDRALLYLIEFVQESIRNLSFNGFDLAITKTYGIFPGAQKSKILQSFCGSFFEFLN